MKSPRPSPTSYGNVFDYPSGRPERGQWGLRRGLGYASGGPPDLAPGNSGPNYGPAGYGYYGGGGGTGYGQSMNPYFDYYGYSNLDLTDNEIMEEVTDMIHSDPRIVQEDKADIQILVKNGVVTLSGEVKRRHSKMAAFRDAYWQPGVVDVNNNIKLKPRQES